MKNFGYLIIALVLALFSCEKEDALPEAQTPANDENQFELNGENSSARLALPYLQGSYWSSSDYASLSSVLKNDVNWGTAVALYNAGGSGVDILGVKFYSDNGLAYWKRLFAVRKAGVWKTVIIRVSNLYGSEWPNGSFSGAVEVLNPKNGYLAYQATVLENNLTYSYIPGASGYSYSTHGCGSLWNWDCLMRCINRTLNDSGSISSIISAIYWPFNLGLVMGGDCLISGCDNVAGC